MMSNTEDDNSDMHQTFVKQILRAASEGNIKSLQENLHILSSVSTECRNEHGWTPLMLAVRNGHTETAELLLQNGADPKAMNKSGQTAVDIALFWNHASTHNAMKKFLEPAKGPTLELVNFFGHSSVDRQSYKRTDAEHIKSVMHSDTARFMIFADMSLLGAKLKPPTKGYTALLFTWKEMENLLNGMEASDYDLIFLGVGDIDKGRLFRETHVAADDDLAYFAVNFKKSLTEEQFSIEAHGGEYLGRGYNVGVMQLRKEESGLVAQARSMLAWHEKYIYCPTCGSQTTMADSGYKRKCDNDGCISHRGAHNTCFPRTDPVVIVQVISKDGSKCLLGRQSRHPPRMYSCVAGFMEPGETIEDAARREVMEECGVKVGEVTYHSSQPWPFPSNLMIGLIGHAVSDELQVDQVELEDARWFERAEVATALVEGFKRPEGLIVPPRYAIAHQLMKSWLQMSSNL